MLKSEIKDNIQTATVKPVNLRVPNTGSAWPS